MQIHHGQTKRKTKQMTIIYMEIYRRGETKKNAQKNLHTKETKKHTQYTNNNKL